MADSLVQQIAAVLAQHSLHSVPEDVDGCGYKAVSDTDQGKQP